MRNWKFGLIGLIVLLATSMSPLLAAPPAFEVPTTAVKILSERNFTRGAGTNWVSEAEAAQGDLLSYGINFYMARNAGTLGTNSPVFQTGIETNGAVVLQYVDRTPRRGFVIQNQDAGTVWLGVYDPAESGAGFSLIGTSSHWSESGSGCPQGSIWAVSASGTNTVSALEW